MTTPLPATEEARLRARLATLNDAIVKVWTIINRLEEMLRGLEREHTEVLHSLGCGPKPEQEG